jgi:hypothetical protein
MYVTQGSTVRLLRTALNICRLEGGTVLLPNERFGLDAIVYPSNYGIANTGQSQLGEPFGVLCFEQCRTREQLLDALKRSDSHYHLKKYVFYAVDCDRVDWVLRNLPRGLRKEVSVYYLTTYPIVPPRIFSVILMYGSSDLQKGDSQILDEIQSALINSDVDEVWLQIGNTFEQRGERIRQFLIWSGCVIEELGESRTSTGYRVERPTHSIKLDESKRLFSLKGRESLKQGLRVQWEVTESFKAKGLRIAYSFRKGDADIIVFEKGNRVIQVVAVKSYTLDVTNRRGCRNTKGSKYAASLTPSKEAKAEVKTAKEHNLDKIRLIVVNLKTGNRIFDSLVSLDQTVTIREYSKDFLESISNK